MTPERPAALPVIRLTELTSCGGCAAKLGADVLGDVLAGLGVGAGAPSAHLGASSRRVGRDATDLGIPEDLIVGLRAPDDAAVYRIAPDIAVIGTVDFFPPLVDDPTTFGEIAAANAVSDVFAMGGHVLFALSIAAFPEELPRETLAAIFSGAATIVREAGGVLAGGHTIRDPEPKYGLAVVGAAHPDRLLLKGGARPGDTLILTKPLGTGLLVSGHRSGIVAEEHLQGAIASMRRLDRAASEVLVAAGVRGATDVTGFGLLGHGLEMARAASVRLVFDADALPALDGALAVAEAGIQTDGSDHNRRFVGSALEIGTDVASAVVALAFDPQTSGGLLAAVPPRALDAVEGTFRDDDLSFWRIGRVEEGEGLALG